METVEGIAAFIALLTKAVSFRDSALSCLVLLPVRKRQTTLFTAGANLENERSRISVKKLIGLSRHL